MKREELTVKNALYGILMGVAVMTLSVPDAHAAVLNLNVELQYQQRGNWCWAASVQMILKYRGRHFADQCEIAELARIRDTTKFGATNCCLNPGHPGGAGTCNNANLITGFGSMRDILTFYNINNGETTSALSYASSKAQVDAGYPFVPLWVWSAGGAHFVVVSGYSDAHGATPDQLYVNNPITGASWTDYSAVVSPPGGSWNSTMQTGQVGLTNDRVSLYRDLNFSGGFLATSSTTYVGDSFNDVTTSAKVRGVPYILYKDGNYTNTAWTVTPRDYDNDTQWGVGANDAISSVMKMPGSDQATAIVLFEHDNFNGAYRVVTSDDANLNGSGWNDRVSSLIVVGPIWNLYSGTSNTGTSYTVTSFGGPNRDGFYPNAASWGGPNDDASSLYYVPEVWNPIILYANSSLSGRAVALWSTMSGGVLNNLSLVGFNEQASSIRTFGGNWTVYRDANQTGVSAYLTANRWYANWSDWDSVDDAITSLFFSNTGSHY